jgi:dienelactone hydrolase
MGTVVVVVVVVVVVIVFGLMISSEEPEFVASIKDDTKGSIHFLDRDGTTSLTGYMYLPSLQNPATGTPVIVLSHCLGLVQGSGLTPFVDAFQSAGFAIFTFDYAMFSVSDGFPCHQIHPTWHISEIQAAITMIKEKGKSDFNVDVTNIGLWGTSLGGGHFLHMASKNDPSIQAIVSQVPHVASGLESVLGLLIRMPRNACMEIIMFALGLIKWSLLWSMQGKAAYFPIVELPAMIQNPANFQGYVFLAHDVGQYGWENAAMTSSVLHVMTYCPINVIASIQSFPVLLFAAEKDILCPTKFIQQAQGQIEGAELLVMPNVGYCDVYQGKALETMLAAEVDFFKKHML